MLQKVSIHLIYIILKHYQKLIFLIKHDPEDRQKNKAKRIES
jgi:hypothetical protein